MDTSKWKSVLVQKPIYDEIVTIARIEGRTISGQLRLVFESWKKANLSRIKKVGSINQTHSVWKSTCVCIWKKKRLEEPSMPNPLYCVVSLAINR